jgi:nitrogen regulatory protein P-II 1
MAKKLHLITAVVQHKDGNSVLEAALAAGAHGATYFFAQGTGVRQTLGPKGEDIEVGKRVITIVCETSKTDKVLAAVIKSGRLDQPGQGVAYVQEVVKAVGFGAD